MSQPQPQPQPTILLQLHDLLRSARRLCLTPVELGVRVQTPRLPPPHAQDREQLVQVETALQHERRGGREGVTVVGQEATPLVGGL